jgi:uncharacterized membrane protein YsdA (DUF1294 family)/cold shock CspA family protein
MRQQGRLTEWHDEKGYGFATPEGGGPRTFVHIRAFSYRERRPRKGDLISYQPAKDERGRPRAENVLFKGLSSEAPPHVDTPRGVTPVVWFVALFMAAVTTLSIRGSVAWFVPLIYLTASLALFIVYAFDKSAAMNRRWRTSEATLHVCALLGGWPGALIAQRLFRHKSKKTEFQAATWFIVAGHVVLAIALAAGWIEAPPPFGGN